MHINWIRFCSCCITLLVSILYSRWVQLCCILIYVAYIAYYNMETFCPERARKKGCNMLGQKDEKGSMEAWAGISLHHQGKVCRSLGYVIDIVMNMMQLTISESEIAKVICAHVYYVLKKKNIYILYIYMYLSLLIGVLLPRPPATLNQTLAVGLGWWFGCSL